MTTFPARTYDVLVVGAGPAGSSAARLLAQGGAKILLVDPLRHRCRRLELVGPRTLPIFEDAGLSHVVLHEGISHPCQGIRKNWGRSGIQVDEFLRYPGGRGYVLDRVRFDTESLAMARNEGTHLVQGTVAALRIANGAIVAEIRHSGTSSIICAALVVDATGRPASIARRLGARRTVHEHLLASLDEDPGNAYHLQGQWLDVAGHADAWQYTLVGPGGQRQFWSVRRGKGSFSRTSTRQSYCDASSTSLDVCAGPHWIAIGDAAAAYDPISSQGLATALASAVAASSLVLTGGLSDPFAQRQFSALVARTHARTEGGRQALYAATA